MSSMRHSWTICWVNESWIRYTLGIRRLKFVFWIEKTRSRVILILEQQGLFSSGQAVHYTMFFTCKRKWRLWGKCPHRLHLPGLDLLSVFWSSSWLSDRCLYKAHLSRPDQSGWTRCPAEGSQGGRLGVEVFLAHSLAGSKSSDRSTLIFSATPDSCVHKECFLFFLCLYVLFWRGKMRRCIIFLGSHDKWLQVGSLQTRKRVFFRRRSVWHRGVSRAQLP